MRRCAADGCGWRSYVFATLCEIDTADLDAAGKGHGDGATIGGNHLSAGGAIVASIIRDGYGAAADFAGVIESYGARKPAAVVERECLIFLALAAGSGSYSRGNASHLRRHGDRGGSAAAEGGRRVGAEGHRETRRATLIAVIRAS